MKAFYVEADWVPREGYDVSTRERVTQRAQRGCYIWKNFRYGVTERPMPVVGDDMVLLKVGACGVCGSDVHVLQFDEEEYTIYPNHCRFPIILGHEFSGEVVEVGKNVKSLELGDLVCVEEMHYCSECESCRWGMFNQCKEIEEPGLSQDGGFAEYVAVRAKYCFKLNDIAENLGSKMEALEAGALVEPTSVAYNGMFIRGGGFQPGGHVVIFGTGPIGLAATALARTSGAGKIIDFEVTPERQALAKKMGADYVYNPIELQKQGINAADLIMDITKGRGAAMFVEAAGKTSANYPIIAKSLAINGKAVQIGLVKGDTPVDLVAFQLQGAHISGSNGHSGHGIFPSVISLMASKRIDMRQIVTARMPLDQTEEAITEIAANTSDGKVLVSQYFDKVIR